MKPVVRVDEHNFLWFWCPGCKDTHVIPVKGPKAWSWNQSLEKPTCSPSVLLTWGPNRPNARCHLFIRNGELQFCGDSKHDHAGKTVPLMGVEDWPDERPFDPSHTLIK